MSRNVTLKIVIDRMKHWATELRQKGRRYWLTVFVLLAIGLATGELLGEHHVWIHLRYQIYKKLQDFTTWKKRERRTVLVLINDDDYWKGALERRVPLKRDYLATLLEELAKGEPSVIALDIDLRSPIPELGTADLDRYKPETETLLQAIKKISEKRRVILSTSLTDDGAGYVVDPNVFDGYDFDPQRVLHGYISVPFDLRKVPLAQRLKNGKDKEDSFASAIARTRDADLVEAAEEDGELPYGDFYAPDHFQKLTAGEALRIDEGTLRDKIQGRIVIVGGAWHTGAYKGTDEITDDSVDLHFTPAGNIQGAYVQANYVEALLSGTVRQQLSEPIAIAIEILCSLLIAISFALEGSLRRKYARAGFVCSVVIVMSYFLWQNLGLFFDFFIPIVLLSAHAPIEEFRETRAELRKLQKQSQSENTEQQPDEPMITESDDVVIAAGSFQ